MRTTVVAILFIVFELSNAYCQSDPGFYDVSYSDKKFVSGMNLKDDSFVKSISKKTEKTETRVENGVLTLECLIKEGCSWGFKNAGISSDSWEIETVVKPENSCDFFLLLNGEWADSSYNLIAISNNKRQLKLRTVLDTASGNPPTNTYDLYEWLQKDTCFTITVRRNMYSMEVFIDHRFVGFFPKESLKTKGESMYWGLFDTSKLKIYSAMTYLISSKSKDEFIAKNPPARLDGIDESRKTLLFAEDFKDNSNQWKELARSSSQSSNKPGISGGNLNCKKNRAIKMNIIDFNNDFEVETMIKKSHDFGTIRIGCSSSGYNGGIQIGLWADRSYQTYNPPRHFVLEFDSFHRCEGGSYTPGDQVKILVRKLGDVLYVFADDKFLTALYPCREMGNGICFDNEAKVDYVKVRKIK